MSGVTNPRRESYLFHDSALLLNISYHIAQRPATQTNKDPNRDKTHPGSNQPRTSETCIDVKTMSLGVNYSFYVLRALSLRNLVSGYECGRVFPAGVGPGSLSRDAANWLPSRFGLSVETRRRYMVG